jgi:integrase
MDEIPQYAVKAIMKDGTRVLTLKEYWKLKEHLSAEYNAICDVMLHTGMRMPELRKFAENPDWYDGRRRCIELPRKAIKKEQTVYKYRQINLTIDGCKAVDHFQKLIAANMKIPSRQAMIGVLCRAAIAAELPDGDKGIQPKMFRKILVSLLMKIYPDRMFEIANNMGHTLDVMQTNYTNLSMAPEDVADAKKFLKGWGNTE